MTKVFKRIFDLLFILIIVVLASYFVLRSFKVIEVYNVKTGSMEDNIHVGDYVLIIRKKDYEIGDVVTFKKDNFLVTHRIIKKANDFFITKGDANNEEDGPITNDQIVGKVIIIGGLLNIIIRYKYLLASIFISLYLLSCYLFGESEEEITTTVNEDKKEDNQIIESTPKKTEGRKKSSSSKKTSTTKKKTTEDTGTETKPKRGRPRKTTEESKTKTTSAKKKTSTTVAEKKKATTKKTKTDSEKPKRTTRRKKETE